MILLLEIAIGVVLTMMALICWRGVALTLATLFTCAYVALFIVCVSKTLSAMGWL